ncbi:MAG: hypothetical protein K6E10_06395 [Eubacterium sp.]|nr:hypothetical protein [Eubacterium sp.]
MQLKKDPEQAEGTGKLINSSFFEEALHSEGVDDAHRKYSNDYSRSGTNTGYAGTAINEWDQDLEKNSFMVSKERAAEILAPTSQEIRKKNARLLKVSEYILYAFFILLVIFLALACTKPSVDILFSIRNLPVFLIIVEAYIIFDSILVYNLSEKKIGLFIFAIFLGLLYPIYRNRIVVGNGIGIVFSLLTVIAFIMVGVTIGRAQNKFGNTLNFESQHVRHEVAALYEQNIKAGQTLGVKLKRRFTITEASTNIEDGLEILTLHGNGTVYVDNSGSTTNSTTINTTLTFTREIGSSEYEIQGVTLDDNELNENLVIKYWTVIKESL